MPGTRIPIVTDLYERFVELVTFEVPLLPTLERGLEQLLAAAQAHSGLPWAAILVLAVVAVRALLWPASSRVKRSMFVLLLLRPHMSSVKRREDRTDEQRGEDLVRLCVDNRLDPGLFLILMALQWLVMLVVLRVLLGADYAAGASSGELALWSDDSPSITTAALAAGATGWVLLAVLVVTQTIALWINAILLRTAHKLVAMGVSFALVPFTVNFPLAVLLCLITLNIVLFVEHRIMRARVERERLVLPRPSDEAPLASVPLRLADAQLGRLPRWRGERAGGRDAA